MSVRDLSVWLTTAIALTASVVPSSASLLGSTVHARWMVPDLNRVYIDGGSAVVSTGIEYPSTLAGNYIDITDNQFILNLGPNETATGFQPAPFNGFVLDFENGSPLSNVSIDPASGFSPVNMQIINGTQLQLNYSGVPVGPNMRSIINIGTQSSLPPLQDIPEKQVVGINLSCTRTAIGICFHPFGYHFKLMNQEFVINVNVDIIGYDPIGNSDFEILKARWKKGVDTYWDGFSFSDGTNEYPIDLNLNFVDADADLQLTVHEGQGVRTTSRDWYTDITNQYSDSQHEALAAHEFGHLIGLLDEYTLINNGKSSIPWDSKGLMSTLRGHVQQRYFAELLNLANSYSSRTLVYGNAPLDGPIVETLEGDLGADHDGVFPIFEPSTVSLISIALLSLLVLRLMRVRTHT